MVAALVLCKVRDMSWRGNAFQITGPFMTGSQWSPSQITSDADLKCCLGVSLHKMLINEQLREAGELRHLGAHLKLLQCCPGVTYQQLWHSCTAQAGQTDRGLCLPHGRISTTCTTLVFRYNATQSWQNTNTISVYPKQIIMWTVHKKSYHVPWASWRCRRLNSPQLPGSWWWLPRLRGWSHGNPCQLKNEGFIPNKRWLSLGYGSGHGVRLSCYLVLLSVDSKTR